MRPLDYVKATALGILILALDLLAAFAAVWFYSLAIDPGHPASYYRAAAVPISTASTRIVGPVLFALAVWVLSRRHPERNPWLFAAVTFLAYCILDGAMVAYQSFFTRPVLLIMLLKLSGASVGAGLAVREFKRRGASPLPRSS